MSMYTSLTRHSFRAWPERRSPPEDDIEALPVPIRRGLSVATSAATMASSSALERHSPMALTSASNSRECWARASARLAVEARREASDISIRYGFAFLRAAEKEKESGGNGIDDSRRSGSFREDVRRCFSARK